MAKIGIALGSGSAKGWAHIGVLKALAELGIKPDIVAGCSVGAFVGAAYATGNLSELERWVNSFSSWNLMRLMDISWRRGGLMSGERVFEQSRLLFGATKVEDLDIPFIAVATDLYSGNEVWLKTGNLQDVVRASCSVPGLLAPKRLGDRYFIDGAVVNPLPVNICRSLGADLVIAVDLYGYPLLLNEDKSESVPDNDNLEQGDEDHHFKRLIGSSRDYFNGLTGKNSRDTVRVPNMFAVMSTAMEILEYRQKKSRLAGDPPEILIQPRVAQISSMEFNRAPEAIAAGEEAVHSIAHLIDSELRRFS